MNENHARLCPSPEWASYVQNDLLPQLTTGVELGPRMLEIGPGPGATTDWLRERVETLVAVELEESTVVTLRQRFAGTNVEVVHGDASHLPFDDDSFDSVGTFTMLHHVPTPALQNQVLAEVLRVLRPGGTLVASDSLPSSDLHDFHVGDVYNPIEPGSLITRLQTVGFGAVTVSSDYAWTARARKPDPERDGVWDHGDDS
jgi:ubiquinone/menaquinone biosynthesis C-methylase UbiE